MRNLSPALPSSCFPRQAFIGEGNIPIEDGRVYCSLSDYRGGGVGINKGIQLRII